MNLISILGNLLERPMTRGEIAELAYRIEVGKLGAPVGKQDQYASAFGGINVIRFVQDGVDVEPLRLAPDTASQLERNLMLFFTGNSRSAWEILRQQRDATRDREPVVVDALHEIKRLALETEAVLKEGDLARFGTLLNESWHFKKRLSPEITSQIVDEAYAQAVNAGAIGGKITGAGGGGYLLLYCEQEAQPSVKRALTQMGFQQMYFAFEYEGARIVMNSGINVPEPLRRSV